MNEEPTVIHNAEGQRFELLMREETAYLEYSRQGTNFSLDHTYVPDALRGLGVGGILVRAAVMEAKKQGWSIVPHCSFVVAYLQRHPELA